jgi:BASS family bile acid:Na+ symporter
VFGAWSFVIGISCAPRRVLQFLRTAVQYIAPVFVICTMLNVGLTQKPSAIAAHLKNWSFVLKMLLANFIFAPLLMIVALYFAPFDPALKAGLLIFCLGAGAPFLIKLTQTAEHDLSLGAAVMMVLMVVTVPYMPLVLPRLLSGVSVDALAIAKALLLQMLLPIGVGMLLAQFLPRLSKKAQPWVGRLETWPCTPWWWPRSSATSQPAQNHRDGRVSRRPVVCVAAAFGLGYLAGWGKDHLEDVGGSVPLSVTLRPV